MKTKGTLVPDIRNFTRMPGAFQYDSTDRCLWYACPCGCGLLGSLTLLALEQKPLEQRALPTARFPIFMSLFSAGIESVHWQGTLKDGIFDGFSLHDQTSSDDSAEGGG